MFKTHCFLGAELFLTWWWSFGRDIAKVIVVVIMGAGYEREMHGMLSGRPRDVDDMWIKIWMERRQNENDSCTRCGGCVDGVLPGWM